MRIPHIKLSLGAQFAHARGRDPRGERPRKKNLEGPPRVRRPCLLSPITTSRPLIRYSQHDNAWTNWPQLLTAKNVRFNLYPIQFAPYRSRRCGQNHSAGFAVIPSGGGYTTNGGTLQQIDYPFLSFPSATHRNASIARSVGE